MSFPPLNPATIGQAFRDGRAYDSKIVPLHRGAVRPAPIGDAVFLRTPEVADLDTWLERSRKRIGVIDWIDLAAKAIIVAGLGAGVAVWWPL